MEAYGVKKDKLYTVKGGEDYQFDGFSVRVIPGIHSALADKHYFSSETYKSGEVVAPLRINQFIEGGSLKNKYPPAVAALASDIAIHGYLHAVTAGLESALAGIPTLLHALINKILRPVQEARPALIDSPGD